MPATTQSTGAETFAGFDERRYQLRCVECKPTVSPPPDNRDQYAWTFALEGTRDEENGGEIKRRCWTSQIWNDTPGKESHLVLLARALCGNQVSQEDFEALDYPDLVGRTGSAMVQLDQKGWPTIDKTTFRPVGNVAPKNQAALPQTVATPAPAPATPIDFSQLAPVATPTKPSRPVVKPASDLRTAEQVEELMGRAAVNDPPLSAEEVEAWVAASYPGKTVATMSKAEAEALVNALLPF